MNISIVRYGDERLTLGEGAHWDSRRQELLVVDIDAGDVFAHGARTSRIHTTSSVGKAVPDSSGGLVIANARGFAGIDRTGTVTWIREILDDPAVRMNDGAVDPRGRFVAGSMSTDEAPGAGALHMLDLDGECRTLRSGLTIPNGIVWNDAGDRCFVVDSGQRKLFACAYDVDSGEIEFIRAIAEWEGDTGVPDGMTIDDQQSLWIAIWDGARLENRDLDGDLIGSYPMPVRRPTSLAFGGPSLSTLFLTSAQGAADPMALDGALFEITVPGVRGAVRGAHYLGDPKVEG